MWDHMDDKKVTTINDQWLEIQRLKEQLARAAHPVFKDPQEFPPPGGTVLILQDTGNVIMGKWRNDGHCVKWFPIPDR